MGADLNFREKSFILETLQNALDYVGDEDGTCDVCGGDGKTLDYHKDCPCCSIRQAILMMNKK